MNRHYTKKSYLELVAKVRKSMPDVVLTTDIIVGYPGEKEKEFTDTLDVVRKAKFEMIFIGQYSPRSGTKSAKLPDNISKEEKKRRDKVITELLAENLEKVNKKFVGVTETVLIDEKKGDRYYGRTTGYKVVEINDRDHTERATRAEGSEEISRQARNDKIEIGQFYDVKILKSSAWKLFGRI